MEGNPVSNVNSLIQEIIKACKNDKIKTEIALLNFEQLIQAMSQYEMAPKYYNAVLEEVDIPTVAQNQAPFSNSNEKRSENDQSKYPIIGDLEKIYGRRLKQKELQLLGNTLATKTGLKLDRVTKRSKIALLSWFSKNWQMLHPKIYEFGLKG